MRKQACVVCRGTKNVPFCENEEGRYVSCVVCGHVYTETVIDDLAVRSRRTGKGTHHASAIKRQWDYSTRKDKYVYEPRFRRIEAYVSKGRILDVGCSNGSFLYAARRRGWDTCGIELSLESQQIANEMGIPTYDKPLGELSLPSDHFSAVTLWQVLEHLSDPDKELAEIHRVLRPGGLLALSTPNIRSIGWKILRSRWAPIMPGGHFNLFSRAGLDQLLGQNGFEARIIETLDITPATVRRLARNRFREGGAKKTQNTVAQWNSSLPSVWIRILLQARPAANTLLKALGIGEDLYGYFQKPG